MERLCLAVYLRRPEDIIHGPEVLETDREGRLYL